MRQIAGNECALRGRETGCSELRVRVQQAVHSARRAGHRHVKEVRGAARSSGERLHIGGGVAKEECAVCTRRMQFSRQRSGHLQVIKRRGHGKSIGRR